MARPQKIGLDYFPLDVDIDRDDKIAIIEAQHGLVGFSVIIKLLMKIYSEGYYYDWTEKEQILFSKRVNVDINELNVIINDSVKWGLFDESMFSKQGILTSRGIQIRYFEAVKRRQKVEVLKEFLLLDAKTVSLYNNLIIVSINDGINTSTEEVNVNINPQSKVKESKEDNIIINKSDSSNPTHITKPSVQERIFEHWNDRQIIQHRNLTDKLKRSINGALKDYTETEVYTAIDNYKTILSDAQLYYWTYKWGLKEFLQRGLDKFINFETAAQNYAKDSIKGRADPRLKKKLDFNRYPQHEYTNEELDSLFENIGN